ncbi:MAG: hypothetical protein IPH84_20500 [Bacteroidales bacterium]|nr:hypothetical protein [Bacteroidales bacterium]
MKNLLLIFCLTVGLNAISQVAVNTDGTDPDNSAMLDVKSTTRGLCCLKDDPCPSECNRFTGHRVGAFPNNDTPRAIY